MAEPPTVERFDIAASQLAKLHPATSGSTYAARPSRVLQPVERTAPAA